METKKIFNALVNSGEEVKSLKLNSVENVGEAKFAECTLKYEDCEMDVCFIIYDDGTWFSPYDWHGYMPKSDEIEEIEWMIGVTGRKATILNGLPRMLV